MVAVRLDTDSGLRVPWGAIVGSGRQTKEIVNSLAVTHAALLTHEENLEAYQRVKVRHMAGPEELRGQVQPETSEVEAHLVAFLEDLTPKEIREMNRWLNLVETQNLPHRYQAHPAHEDVKDTDGRIQARRFSCAGFVERCYSEGAEIQLISSNDIPSVDREFLRNIWPFSRARMEQYGLRDTGPWRVLLPGYLFHAVRNGRVEGGYRPNVDDAMF